MSGIEKKTQIIFNYNCIVGWSKVCPDLAKKGKIKQHNGMDLVSRTEEFRNLPRWRGNCFKTFNTNQVLMNSLRSLFGSWEVEVFLDF